MISSGGSSHMGGSSIVGGCGVGLRGCVWGVGGVGGVFLLQQRCGVGFANNSTL